MVKQYQGIRLQDKRPVRLVSPVLRQVSVQSSWKLKGQCPQIALTKSSNASHYFRFERGKVKIQSNLSTQRGIELQKLNAPKADKIAVDEIRPASPVCLSSPLNAIPFHLDSRLLLIETACPHCCFSDLSSQFSLLPPSSHAIASFSRQALLNYHLLTSLHELSSTRSLTLCRKLPELSIFDSFYGSQLHFFLLLCGYASAHISQ